MIQYLIIDLFCGAGGWTTGAENARDAKGNKVAKVIACVNHDELAIESHAANHPDVLHFREDIRTMQLAPLVAHVAAMRQRYPTAKVILHASLECTNFSNAKGGLPRDGDSRTLANDLFRYEEALPLDYITIENVREFMSWGPLDEKGKPLSRLHGRDYVRWCNKMQQRGYQYTHRLLNAADFGAYTSRIRFFGIFSRPGLASGFPQPTHARNPDKAEMFGAPLHTWMPVRDVLDLHEEGESIFNRSKPLVERTLRRILAGLKKYATKQHDHFITKYYGSADGSFDNGYSDINAPAPTLTTSPQLGLVSTEFLTTYYGKGGFTAADHPCPTLGTKDTAAKVKLCWLDKQYNADNNHQSVEVPAGTLMTNNKFALVTALPFLLDGNGFGQDRRARSLEEPAPTLLASRRNHYLVNCNSSTSPCIGVDAPAPTITTGRTHFLVNPQYGNGGSAVDAPCFTLIARMDKKPPYLVSLAEGKSATKQAEVAGNATMREILDFMAEHGIVDIKLRMLNIQELKRITGFPESYVLRGPKAAQKKFIGNAVPCLMAQRIIENLARHAN